MAGTEKAQWEEACQQEIAAHMENGTWQLVELPHGRTPVGSRWVFHIKRTADGSIERYKACLVAQGFSQRPGWNYVESFAPTIWLSVVRALFALVAADWYGGLHTCEDTHGSWSAPGETWKSTQC